MIQSKQLKQRKAIARFRSPSSEVSGKLRYMQFNVDITEEENQVQIAALPGGIVRLVTPLCRMVITCDGDDDGLVEMSVGHESFLGQPVRTEASEDAIVPATTVKVNTMIGFGGAKQIEGFAYNASSEVVVNLHFSDPLPAGSAITGFLAYVND